MDIKEKIMVGLALEGGGVKGSYQAGVYLAFLQCHIHIDGVCGTSIGAINAAIIASGKGENLVRIWKNVNIGEIFGLNSSFVESIVSRGYSFRNIKIIVKEIVRIIKNKGISFSGLRNLIRKEVDMNKLKASDMDFGLVTVRANRFEPIYIWKEDIPLEKLEDYLIASASLPIFKLEKMIDDNYYLDGGFYDNSPVNMLLKKGYHKVYLVKIHGIGLARRYPVDADVKVIESKRSLGHIIELDQSQILENIKMGYYDAIRVLKGLDGEKYVFKNKKEKFYSYLNRKVQSRKYRRVQNFFNTKSYKDTTIKALEYIMERENIDYYKIYQPKKVLRKLKKKIKKDHFVYDYVKNLSYFI